MDIERALVTKIIWTGQIDKVLGRQISRDMFADDECRDVFDYISKHTKQYGSAPSVEAAKHSKPDFDWLIIQDSLDWLIDEFAIVVMRRLADEYLCELAEACNDPVRSRNIDGEFLEVSRKLITAIPSPEIARFRDAEARIREYERRKKEGSPLGVPFGYPTLDRLTGGLQRHELATVLGFTNVGKSTLLRSFAFNFWVKGYTPLYISLEMESDVILRIFDAMAAALDYTKMKQLALDDIEMEKWRSHAIRIKKRSADIPVIDSKNRVTPDYVFAAMVRHKPQVVILDYVGLMKATVNPHGMSRYAQLSEITPELKHMARTLKIPIIMAAQTNRSGSKEGAEMDNVADSVTIVQDSDLVIAMHQDDAMQERNRMRIGLKKNRDGPRGNLEALWNFDTHEFRELTPEDRFAKHNGNGSQNPVPVESTTPTGAQIRFGRRNGN